MFFNSFSKKESANTEVSVTETEGSEKNTDSLDLLKPEELSKFEDGIEQAYAEAVELTAVAEADGYAKITFEDISGEEIFEALNNKFEIALKTLSLIQETEDESELQEYGDSLQSLYDEILTLRNFIVDAYEMKPEDIKQVPAKPTTVIPQAAANEDLSSSSRKSKVMSIVADNDDGDIEIKLAVEAEKAIARRMAMAVKSRKQRPTNNIFIPRNVIDPNKAPVAAMERFDPINSAVPHNTHAFARIDRVHEKTNLVKDHLSEPRYKNFILQNFSSANAFEKILDSTITDIEAPAYDQYDNWFARSYVSPFTFLQNMAIEEVEHIGSLSTEEKIKLMNKEKIKYRAFLNWMDELPFMKEKVRVEPDTTFGELYAKWMVESIISGLADREEELRMAA